MSEPTKPSEVLPPRELVRCWCTLPADGHVHPAGPTVAIDPRDAEVASLRVEVEAGRSLRNEMRGQMEGQITGLRAEVERLTRERDEAQAKWEFFTKTTSPLKAGSTPPEPTHYFGLVHCSIHRDKKMIAACPECFAGMGWLSPDPAASLRATSERYRKALESVKAALGDRLFAKGPLSKEYAHSVMRQINEALGPYVRRWTDEDGCPHEVQEPAALADPQPPEPKP